MKTIAIIGGMGPEAGLFAHQLVLKQARQKFGDSSEHLPTIIHLTLPIKDFSNDEKSINLAVTQIKRGLKKFNLSESSNVILACNTAHVFAEKLTKATDIEIRSLIESTRSELKRRDVVRVGILASATSFKFKLHELDDIEVIKPTEEEINLIGKIISEVIRGSEKPDHLKILQTLTKRMFRDGAEAIVLGCTELEMILSSDSDFRLIRPLSLTIAETLGGHE